MVKMILLILHNISECMEIVFLKKKFQPKSAHGSQKLTHIYIQKMFGTVFDIKLILKSSISVVATIRFTNTKD
jgi:predicted type IV restriction endonuclease